VVDIFTIYYSRKLMRAFEGHSEAIILEEMRDNASKTIQRFIRKTAYKCSLLTGVRNLNQKLSIYFRKGKVINSKYYIISAYKHTTSGTMLLEAYNVDHDITLQLLVPSTADYTPEALHKNCGVSETGLYITMEDTGRRLVNVFSRGDATWWLYASSGLTYVEVKRESGEFRMKCLSMLPEAAAE
jgi:hypothetical protein